MHFDHAKIATNRLPTTLQRVQASEVTNCQIGMEMGRMVAALRDVSKVASFLADGLKGRPNDPRSPSSGVWDSPGVQVSQHIASASFASLIHFAESPTIPFFESRRLNPPFDIAPGWATCGQTSPGSGAS